MSEAPAASGSRTILHVDLDAFFAAVEEREDPSLKGRPVIIGSDPKNGRARGVVCTANYAARRFGVGSAMPISEAWRRCPQAVYLRPRQELYGEVSRRFMDILHRFTDLVEPLGIDEAFLDVSHSRRLFGDGVSIARQIRQLTLDEERLRVSVGVAPSKFVAKIASDVDKPDGLVVVEESRVREFLVDLPVARLFGAGKVAQERFRRMGVETIGDVANCSHQALLEAFGESSAQQFRTLARGLDRRPVVPDRVRKSLGKEHTFDVDRWDRAEVLERLFALSAEVAASLRRHGIQGRRVSLKLRTDEFRTLTRSRTLQEGLDRVDQIWPIAKELFAEADQAQRAIRLVGVSLSSLGPVQRGLFDTAPDVQRKVTAVVDAVSKKFGAEALRPATLLRKSSRHRGPNQPPNQQ